MKIKKFKNLWQMGLIIFGAILGVLYLLKLIFPGCVVGIAQIDAIVKFGNYVQSHMWAYYLFSYLVSVFGYYFYCGACCRKKKLNLVDWVIILIANVIILVVQTFLAEYYYTISMVMLLGVPTLICYIDKRQEIKYLYSTVICFAVNTLSQMFSLEIRGISAMITAPNIVTLTILLLDLYIWLVLLYNYYNYKEVK